jgi:ribosomal-protein-alanine N-acetyltransferase
MTAVDRHFRVRAMTAPDLSSVLMIAESLRTAPQWSRAAYLTAIDPAAAVPRLALVAEASVTGKIAGFAVIGIAPPEAELETIAVAPSFQRQGVAQLIFNEASRQLRSRAITEVKLEVRHSNDSAVKFYANAGFEERGRRPHYYFDPIEDAILMRMEL